METGEIVDLRLMRAKFLEHFANRAPCLVAMEACGGSQHWARRIRDLGHEVRLLPAKMVRPFVGGNKNDAHDARAIWTAVQQSWPTRGNYGIYLDCIALREESLGSALSRVREVLEDDDRHLAATLAGQREGESLRMREERIARLFDDPERLRKLRKRRAERRAGEQQQKQQHKGRHWSMRI